MNEPIYRLPPDWSLKEATAPLSEVFDWSINFLGIPDLWKHSRGQANGKPLICAVLDTGVDDSHPDLKGQVIEAADFTDSRFGPRDIHGHGTWCIGCIAANANDIGVRGIAHESKILSGKVLGDNGAGTDESIARGMKWAHDKGARFFSLSLGGGRMSGWLHRLFTEISDDGCFIFCAAGNDGGPVNYPAAWPECIAVGAVDKNGELTKFTSRGPEIDILAPGVEMLSTMPGGKYGAMSGTSMATPEAAAIGMLAYGARATLPNPIDDVAEMLTLLKNTSQKKGQYGLIDPRKLAVIESESKVPSPGISPTPGGVWVFIPGGKVISGQ